jgi:hypothetical protein
VEEPSFEDLIVADFADVGFFRTPASDEQLDMLRLDAVSVGRQVPDDVLAWHGAFGADRFAACEGRFGFGPVSVRQALDWRVMMRGLDDPISPFYGEVFVPLLSDVIGTMVLAFLPLAAMGHCVYTFGFVKENDSATATSMGQAYWGITRLFRPLSRAASRLLPLQFGEIWGEDV